MEEVQRICAEAGLVEGELDWSGSARQVWRRALTRLASGGRLRALGERMLADSGVARHHERLLELASRRPVGALDIDQVDALVERVRSLGPTCEFAESELELLLNCRPSDATTYRLRRLGDWRDPHLIFQHREDLRQFTRLGLLVDKGEEERLRWSEQERDYEDLSAVLRAAGLGNPVLVVLGEPGAGKTTLLRRLELDLACRGLGWDAESGEADPVLFPFYLELADHREHPDAPIDWLRQRWAARYPGMPPFDNMLADQPMLLLLDALNEMPHGGEGSTYSQRVSAWREALVDLRRIAPNLRVVFSCRSLDYSASLSSKALRVPHVQVRRLDDDRIQAFLEHYQPRRAAELWDEISGSGHVDIYRTPYFLKLLVDQVVDAEPVPSGRAALFAGFVRQALRREIRNENILFRAGHLLETRDRQNLGRLGGAALPGRGPLSGALGFLAHTMQCERGAGQQIVVDREEAEGWMVERFGEEVGQDVILAGYALGLVGMPFDDKTDREWLRFNHQLMQEFFAARWLMEHPEPTLAHTPWRATEVAEPLEDTISGLAEGDLLPGLPRTGWEVTMRLAAAMAPDADAFVESLLDHDLPLSARCAIEPGTSVRPGLGARLGRALLERCQDPAADLRARIDAAEALGELGDPRLEPRRGPEAGVRYLEPDLVRIPQGEYWIGSDRDRGSRWHDPDGWARERPAHPQPLASFSVGRFPVTNAEYACFVEAGGYTDERWWETKDAKAWLRGDAAVVEPVKAWQREDWARYPKDDAGFEAWKARRSNATPSYIQWVDWFRSLDTEALEAQLARWYPIEPQTAPAYWTNDRYNHPAQPVVGVSWYEARAYCAWLSTQSGRTFRLPSEIEWEAVARGTAGRRFAYGKDHDAWHCNTYESHIRRPSPIDVYPGGRTPEEVSDICGNVWEWTISLWGRDSNQPEFGYPYVSDDGRENLEADAGCLRVVRGGSWGSPRIHARAAYRHGYFPAGRVTLIGFRVVCASPIS